MYRKIRCDGYCSTFLELLLQLNTGLVGCIGYSCSTGWRTWGTALASRTRKGTRRSRWWTRSPAKPSSTPWDRATRYERSITHQFSLQLTNQCIQTILRACAMQLSFFLSASSFFCLLSQSVSQYSCWHVQYLSTFLIVQWASSHGVELCF